MRTASMFAMIMMVGVIMAAIYWGTNSVRSLLLLPAVIGLSTILVDDITKHFQRVPTRYSFGPVQYGFVLLWLIGGLVGLLMIVLA